MKKKHIAIIGGGGAGAVAAWSLNKVHHITLFEAEAALGGHAYTEKVHINQDIFVDLAVEFFSEKQAPNLFALLSYFGIETFVAPLSFGAAYDQSYWSNNGINGLLWDKVADECSKFHIQMHEIMHARNAKSLTLGEFLKEERYSKEFIYQALLPLLTTFASSNASLLEYSLIFCAVSFSTGLLSFFHPTYWRKSKEGIGRYLQHISQVLKDKIYLNSKVTKVERYREHIVVYLPNGKEYYFDEVVLATHADTALSLISNPTDAEKKILSQFTYTPIECVLHADTSILIPEFGSKVYCQFNGIGLHQTCLNGTLTRVISALAPYKAVPLMVSFDPKITIANNLIYLKKEWKIPKLQPQDMYTKRSIGKIQGVNKTWFCGTDTSFTGHEGAIVSGLVIADILGAPYPFIENNWAKLQYEVIKELMGVYHPYEKFYNSFHNSMYKVTKALGIKQLPRAVLDLYA